jgi:hypothetical protein
MDADGRKAFVENRVEMRQKTIFSSEPEKVYRYTLWREWQQLGQRQNQFVMFVGLNPSIADEKRDDPTVRRCIEFAKSWGYGALCMTNLFAFRATDPKVMRQQKNPVGNDNLFHLIECGSQAEIVIAAWGMAGIFWSQNTYVQNVFVENRIRLFHLGLTKHGHPRHPLYLKAKVKPKLYEPKKDGHIE